MGHRLSPAVGWAERGGGSATSHGNSVPRFHVTWGTGPGVVEPFERRAREAETIGRIRFRWRHRVDEVVMTNGAATGVRGTVFAPSEVPRGVASLRDPVGDFAIAASAVIVASGGIGGNHEMVRANWPTRTGTFSFRASTTG